MIPWNVAVSERLVSCRCLVAIDPTSRPNRMRSRSITRSWPPRYSQASVRSCWGSHHAFSIAPVRLCWDSAMVLLDKKWVAAPPQMSQDYDSDSRHHPLPHREHHASSLGWWRSWSHLHRYHWRGVSSYSFPCSRAIFVSRERSRRFILQSHTNPINQNHKANFFQML